MPELGGEAGGASVAVAVLEAKVAELARDLAALSDKLDGPPWERSVRGRLHRLEAESAAAKLTSAALAEAKAERRRAEHERQRRRTEARTFRWKAVAAATALALALYPYLAHFGHWHG